MLLGVINSSSDCCSLPVRFSEAMCEISTSYMDMEEIVDGETENEPITSIERGFLKLFR